MFPIFQESHSKSPEGEENVFCIELFCIDEKFEARLVY